MNAIQLTEAIVEVLKVKLVPMIAGSPGIGKSDIIRSIASKFNLFVIDMRLSQCDPTDMLGFPTHNGDRMGYAPPEHFPLSTDPYVIKHKKGSLKENTSAGPVYYEKDVYYAGWLLFLDEFPSAPLAVQAAAYKLVLDRMVGKEHLHEDCRIICAGNKETDGAIVNRMSTAMQSRLVHLELDVDVRPWLDWASAAGLDHRAISYIEGRPDQLHLFDPNHNDKTFACPRTWEFASRLIKSHQDINPMVLHLLVGTLSAGVAHEFNSYLTYCADLPKIADIKARPDDIPIPEDPALLYATAHMVAAYINATDADRLMRFMKRLPLEFGVTAIRATLKRNRELMKVDSVREWAHEVAKEMF